MKSNYFENYAAAETDGLLGMAKAQGYVPIGCLLGGEVVMALVNQGDDPCRGCEGPRARCKGRTK